MLYFKQHHMDTGKITVRHASGTYTIQVNPEGFDKACKKITAIIKGKNRYFKYRPGPDTFRYLRQKSEAERGHLRAAESGCRIACTGHIVQRLPCFNTQTASYRGLFYVVYP
jgi:hypothetical protein